jgi:hypothetical protein
MSWASTVPQQFHLLEQWTTAYGVLRTLHPFCADGQILDEAGITTPYSVLLVPFGATYCTLFPSFCFFCWLRSWKHVENFFRPIICQCNLNESIHTLQGVPQCMLHVTASDAF